MSICAALHGACIYKSKVKATSVGVATPNIPNTNFHNIQEYVTAVKICAKYIIGKPKHVPSLIE